MTQFTGDNDSPESLRKVILLDVCMCLIGVNYSTENFFSNRVIPREQGTESLDNGRQIFDNVSTFCTSEFRSRL